MKRLDRIWTAIDRHPTVTDGVIAALLCALALLTLRINWHVVQPLPGRTAVGLTLLLMLPLTWRRRYPLAVLAAMTATYLLFRIVEVPETIWSINVWWLALFSAGAYGRAPWRDPVRAAAIAALASRFTYELFWRQLPQLAEDRTLYSLLNLAANSLLFGWLWWLGDMMRIRREREIQLAERTVELEIEREEKARRAVLDERVRIARELHDVVAHHVSLMGVQAVVFSYESGLVNAEQLTDFPYPSHVVAEVEEARGMVDSPSTMAQCDRPRATEGAQVASMRPRRRCPRRSRW